jgi:hypothetical protein
MLSDGTSRSPQLLLWLDGSPTVLAAANSPPQRHLPDQAHTAINSGETIPGVQARRMRRDKRKPGSLVQQDDDLACSQPLAAPGWRAPPTTQTSPIESVQQGVG